MVNLPPGMTRINYPVQILDNSVYTGPTVPRMLTVMIVPSMPSNYIINQTCKTADIEITDDEGIVKGRGDKVMHEHAYSRLYQCTSEHNAT